MAALGNHGGFILAAYFVTIVVLGGLVGWIVLDGQSLKRRLADLEALGIRRRSARDGDSR